MHTIKIGDQIVARSMPTRPLKSLPLRLDLAACLAIVAHIDPDMTAESIMAAGKQLDIDRIDSCLEYTELSLEDRMILKSALSEFGLIPRGRKIR